MNLTNNKYITIGAFVSEVLTALTLLLLADNRIAAWSNRDTVIANAPSFATLLSVLLILQYIALILEFVVRKRSHCRGLTIPLVFLPFGNLFRFALIFSLSLLLLIPKLLFYFVTATVIMPLSLFLDRIFRIGHRWIDRADGLAERPEKYVNHLFNLLHFNKIDVNRSIFNTCFNMTLSLWCINH